MVEILGVVCWFLLGLICAMVWALIKVERAPRTMAEIERYWDGKERRRVERRKAGMQ